MTRSRFFQALVLLAVGSACASPPPVDELLRSPAAVAAPAATTDLAALGARLQEDVDAELRDLRARAAAPDAAPALLLATARLLFASADLRRERALEASLRERPPRSLAELLAAEDRLGDGPRGEVLSLCREGMALADRVLAGDPEDPGALFYHALHASQVAWGQGVLRSLAGGWGPRVAEAVERAVEADPAFEGGAPLRLSGRFLGRAPWPYHDAAGSLERLERAAELGPTPVTWLFLGEARHAAGDAEGAAAAWRAAVGARADATTAHAADFHRSAARRRLEWLARVDPTD